MKYRNTNTDEIFTMDEIKDSYEQFKWDMKTEYDSFEEYFEAMCDRGDFEEVEEMGIITVDDFKKAVEVFGFESPVVTAIWNTMEANPNNADEFETVYALHATGRI